MLRHLLHSGRAVGVAACAAGVLAGAVSPAQAAAESTTKQRLADIEARLSKVGHALESRSPPARMINYALYPIDARQSPEYAELVSTARDSLRRAGCFRLPGFVTSDGVRSIKREVLGVVDAGGVIGNQVGRAVNCYYTKGDKSLPESHPLNTFFDRQFGAIRDDMIQHDGDLRKIYDDKEVVSFVADVLGVPKLYQSRDSYQALTVNVMGDEDHLHWHFDCNACAITLGIQVPESGGELEFVPYIGRGSYDSVEQVLAGRYRSQLAVDAASAGAAADAQSGLSTYRYETGEGELVFFCGGQSMHRVRAVKGDRLRLVAALQFDTTDQCFDPPDMTQRIYGVPMEQHVGPKKSVVSSL